MQNEMVKEQDFKELFSELKGIGIEEAKSIYFDEDALKLPPKQLYRLDYRGYRYYYSYDEEGKPKFYISATTMIKNSLPTPPQLIDWMASMGKDESKRYSKERADYGTFMHIQAADFMIEGSYDLDSMDDKLKHFLEENNQPQSLYDKWIVDLKKDVLSFAQFAKDVDLKPIAIEITLSDDKMGVAGTIDIVAQMTIKVKGFWGETYKSGKRKGEDKETYKEIRILCIIDMKSGRKGFYESHEIQLNAYKKLWNKNFPDQQIERVYNWSPNSWRGRTPTYKLKEQTNSKKAEKFEQLLSIAKIEDSTKDRKLTFYRGKLLFKKEFDNNIEEHQLADYVLDKKQDIDELYEKTREKRKKRESIKRLTDRRIKLIRSYFTFENGEVKLDEDFIENVKNYLGLNDKQMEKVLHKDDIVWEHNEKIGNDIDELLKRL